MNKEMLIKRLVECQKEETEEGHIEADGLLLDYINDDDIREKYEEIGKWYA